MYGTIASLAFNKPYEECLEFNPETHEYQPEGKQRRSEAKVILLGLTYGRSVPSIAEQLYGTRDDMADEEKIKGAQKIYDSVMNAFPKIRQLMISSQTSVKKLGYTETILGRRRHLPDLQLPEFEFVAKKGYVNPDIDPLNPDTLADKSQIPERIVKALTEEFKSYKYFGQIAKRIRELDDQGIKVINNRSKINDAKRQTLNCVDTDTEILTLSGWKSYDEVNEGDEILSFNLDKKLVTQDKVKAVHIYEGDIGIISFTSTTFDAVSTPNHRWVCIDDNSDKFRFLTSDNCSSDYSIVQVWDNDLQSRCELADDQIKLLELKDLTFEFVSTLDQHQANVLIRSMIGTDNVKDEDHITYTCLSSHMCDIFQYLAFVAGYVTEVHETSLEVANSQNCIVSIYKHRTTHGKHIHRSSGMVNKVWCVTTGNGTWVAKRNGKVYITGNSIIQGEPQRRPYSSNYITHRCVA